MHATNEQMAEVMGWHESTTPGTYGYYVDAQGTPEQLISAWFPVDDLNHAALVEARLAELELIERYMVNLTKLRITFLPLPIHESTAINITMAYLLATATAQTRCDAAWATWQAWKEQST